MLIRVVIDSLDDGNDENIQVTVAADASMSPEQLREILRLATQVVKNTIPTLSKGDIREALLPPDKTKLN